nr:MAG TPA: hypothetical protein [Bacteriophage sp.]
MSVVDKEIDYWYTTASGKHIPVFKGETKLKALERVKEEKTDVEKINDFQKRQDTKSKAPLDKYKTEIDKTDFKDLEKLDYQKMYDDYEKWYKSLDKQEVNEVLEKLQDYNAEDLKASNPMGDFINEKLGYNNKPELISSKDFFIDEDGNVATDTSLLDENHWYRGISGNNTKEYINEFKNGKFFAGEGYGTNGTYFSQSYSEAYAYTGDEEKNIIYAMPKSNASIIQNRKIQTISSNLIQKIDWNKYMSEEGELYTTFTDYILGDNGYAASLLGYDIVEFETDNRKVILNRGTIKVVK